MSGLPKHAVYHNIVLAEQDRSDQLPGSISSTGSRAASNEIGRGMEYLMELSSSSSLVRNS